MNTFDNIIIGAGPGGYELAAGLAARGESVLIVEKGSLGGTCLNRGCIPTKCLAASAEVAATIHTAATFGISVDAGEIDSKVVFERMKSVVDGLRQGVRQAISKCTLIEGEARLLQDRSICVNNEEFKATNRLVIATGSKPAILPIEGSNLAITSDEALHMDTLPESAVIIGGGVIGMEFASIFAALGVKVTVIEFCKEILPPFDAETAKRLRTALGRRGIEIVVGASVTKIEQEELRLAVTYTGKRGEATVIAEKVIMAVGRRPVVPDGLESAGVEITSRGFIQVDENMKTSVQGIYAIGDVNGLSMLAHSAIAQGRVILDENPMLFDAKRVPSVVFTHPEVAMVGPTPDSLKEQGYDISTVKHLYASNGKANAIGATDGYVKFAYESASKQILGVSIIGAHAADLIAEATILVSEGIKMDDIDKRFIHAHPTLSELF